MSEVIEKARRATKLQASNYFTEFLTEAQDKQIAVFRDVSSSEAERAEAHAILRALDAIKGQMTRAINAGKIASKKASKKP